MFNPDQVDPLESGSNDEDNEDEKKSEEGDRELNETITTRMDGQLMCYLDSND